MRFPEREIKRFLPGTFIASLVIFTVFLLLFISKDWDDDPEAVIMIHPEEVRANTPILLDGRNSTNAEGERKDLTYSWTIMDRVESEHSWLEFSFPRPGNFTIVLKVEEDSGRYDTKSIFVQVLSPVP